MKKVVSCLLAAVLLLSSLPLMAIAGNQESESAATLTVGEASAKAGESVTIPVTFSNTTETSIAGISFGVVYDHNAMTLTSITKGSSLPENAAFTYHDTDCTLPSVETKGYMYEDENWNFVVTALSNGEIALLNFTINSDAEAKDYTISLDQMTLTGSTPCAWFNGTNNLPLNDLTPTTVNGKITVGGQGSGNGQAAASGSAVATVNGTQTIDYAWSYGGTVTEKDGTFTITPYTTTGVTYAVEAVYVNGVKTNVTDSTFKTDANTRSIFVAFGYTVNFPNPDNGTLSVSRDGKPLTSGSIVHAGEVLTITATPDTDYEQDGDFQLTGITYVEGTGYVVSAKQGEATPAISVSFKEAGNDQGEQDQPYQLTANTTATETYATEVQVSFAVNGNAGVNTAKADDVVTVTLSGTLANANYVLYVSSVKDESGNAVAFTQNTNGTYSFKMPESNVKVSAACQGVKTNVSVQTFFGSGKLSAQRAKYTLTFYKKVGDDYFGQKVFELQIDKDTVSTSPWTQPNKNYEKYTYSGDVIRYGDTVTAVLEEDVASGTRPNADLWNGNWTLVDEESSTYKQVYRRQCYWDLLFQVDPTVSMTGQIETSGSGCGTVTVDETGTETVVQRFRVTVAPDAGSYLKSIQYAYTPNAEAEDRTTVPGTAFFSATEFEMIPADDIYYWVEFESLADLAARYDGLEYSGSGSTVSITNSSGLTALRDLVNSGVGFGGVTFQLSNKITLDSSESWAPIGSYYNPFLGTFDGNDQTISGLKVTSDVIVPMVYGDRQYGTAGLFGYAPYSTIENLTVEGEVTLDTQVYRVGGIAGCAKSVVNCVNKVNITLNDIEDANDDKYTGGVVAYVDTIKQCFNLGQITINGNTSTPGAYIPAGNIGGVAGYVATSAAECGNYGNISITMYETELGSSDSTSNVGYNYIRGNHVGGVIGKVQGERSTDGTNKTAYSDPVYVTKCFNQGDITGHFERAGGIVAYACGGILHIDNCYNTGVISQTAKGEGDGGATPTVRLGGIAGAMNLWWGSTSNTTGLLQITNSYSTTVPTCQRSYTYCGFRRIQANDVEDDANLLGKTKVENCDSLSDVSIQTPSIETNGKGEYSLTLNVAGDQGLGYTVVLYDANGVEKQRVEGKVGQSVTFEKLASGDYRYRISAQGYVIETDTVHISLVNRTISTTLRQQTERQVYVFPYEASFALSYAGETVAYDRKDSMYENGVRYAVYTYNSLYADSVYSYTATCSGYVGDQQDFVTKGVGSKMEITLTSRSTNTGTLIYGSGNDEQTNIIDAGGTYYLGDGAKGVLTIKTAEAVTLVGKGTDTSAQYSNLYIKCEQSGANLTLQNVYISNNVGTTNMIDFTGTGNTLTFAGTNVLDQTSGDSGYAMIHVGPSNTLTISCDSDGDDTSDGVAYLYKSEQGAAIGGNGTVTSSATEGEINGTIQIKNANLFIKGTKQGALIGSGAVTGGKNAGKITITHSTLNLIANARGAAIGGGAGSNGAGYGGYVTITDSLVNINVNYTGAAIGGAGADDKNDAGDNGFLTVTRSSVRAYIDENATTAWSVSEAGVNRNKAVKATTTGDTTKLVVLKFSQLPSGTVTVKAGTTLLYSGNLYQYAYINEGRDKSNQLGVSGTQGNWVESTCPYLYLYAPSDYTGDYTVEIDGKTYTAELNTGDAEGTVYVVYPEGVTQLNAPAQLETQSVAATSVTLTAPAKSTQDSNAVIQYRASSDEGLTWTNWQTSTQFTNLMPETTYYFQARYQAKTTGYADSNASFIYVVTTPKDLERFTASTITVSSGTVTATISGTSFSDYVEDGILTADVRSESKNTDSLSVTIANNTLKALTKPYNDAEDAESKEDIYYALLLNTDMGTVRLNYAAVSAILEAAGTEDAVLTMDKTSSADGVVTYSLKLNGKELENADSIDFALSYEKVESDKNKSVVVYDEDNNELKSTYNSTDKQLVFTSYLGSFTIKCVENTSSSNGQQSGTTSISSSVWDGKSLDVSWFTPGKSSYYISTPAQLAGLAALVNGIYNKEIVNIAGDESYIVDNEATGSSGGNNNSTSTYHYGSYNFSGATVYLTADIDMGGSNGANYMPIGGQYLMTKNDTSTKIDASFCGVFDGGGHTVTNISCDRHSSGNYGDGQSVGLIGRLGLHDNDSMDIASGTAVRNVAVEGTIYANRSVGGIVGKIGKTNGGATIENCANFAAVTSTDAKGCGGIVGAGWNEGTIKNCYNAGTITSRYPNPTGGISGSNEVAIENCYNIGKISASSDSYAMAIGTNNGGASTVTNCWYLEGSAPGGGYYSGNTADNSGSRTSEQMKTEDFLNTLGSAFAADSRNINNGYPVLAWQNPSGQKGTGSGSGGSAVTETPAVTETKTDATTEVNGTAATVTADSKALAEAAKTADANTQFVISSDVGDADVSQVTANVEKESVKAVAEAGASVKVETPVANITLPNEALKDIAAQSGATVSVTAELKEDGSTTINLLVDSKSMTKLSGGIKAAIPVILDKISKGINRTTISDSKVPLGETPDSTESTDDTATDSAESTTDSAVSVDMNGLVAVLVGDDGTESIIPKSVIEDGTVYVLLDGSATVKVADNSKTFTDVADTWYTDAVNFAAGHELFNGVSDSEFAPLNKMSRAMLVTVLHRLEGTPSASNSTSFSDVESGKWYTDAISWANANDIVNGLGDGLFGTNNNITREQMATILYRYMKEQGLSVSASGDISSFPDGDSVSSYATEAMSWAIGSGIITGKDSADGTLLDPKGNASRAEVATMLKRMIGIMVK